MIIGTVAYSQCNAPTIQSTNLILTSTTNSVSGTFNASIDADHYLIIRSTLSTLSVLPVDSTIYNAFDTLGGGTVVAYQTDTTITDVNLVTGIQYYYYVFAANSLSCTGEPAYLLTSPLTGSTTCSLKTLDITAIFQEYYNNTTGLMNQTLGINWDTGDLFHNFGSNIVDTLTVLIRSTIPPTYIIEATFNNVNITTNGSIQPIYLNSNWNACPYGEITGYHHIVIKHRNSIETWSDSVDFSGQQINYNFFTHTPVEFAGGMYEDGNGNFEIWGGDVNQNGNLESIDYSEIYLAANSTDPTVNTGYVLDDIDGNGNIDSQDYGLAYNNANLGANIINPEIYYAQPTNLTLTPNYSTVTGSFSASETADHYLIVRSNSGILGASPVKGTIYTAGNTIGNGVVVSYQEGLFFIDTNLNKGTYYYFIFAADTLYCTHNYLTTSPLAASVSLNCGMPLTQASNLNLTKNNTTISGSFTASASADHYLIVRSTSDPLIATPTSGTTYTAGSPFGDGTVVAYQTATTFVDSNLYTCTQYYYTIFAANCTGSPQYLITSPLKAVNKLYSAVDITTIKDTSYFVSSNITWVNFIATHDTCTILFKVDPCSVNIFSNVYMYSGNCDSLTLINTYTMNDTIRMLNFTNLNIGTNYYFEVEFNHIYNGYFSPIYINPTKNINTIIPPTFSVDNFDISNYTLGHPQTDIANILPDYCLGFYNINVLDSWISSGCHLNNNYNGKVSISNIINIKELYPLGDVHHVYGDSYHDDASAVNYIINNLNNYLCTINGPDDMNILYFPAGTYIFKSRIEVLNSNIVIKGDGGDLHSTCLTEFAFLYNSNDAYYHNANIFMNNVKNIVIEDVYITRNDYENGSDDNSHGIYILNATNCWIRGITSSGAWKNNICLDNCINVSVTGSVFIDPQKRGGDGEGYGIILQGVYPHNTHFCLIENNIFSNLRHAIVLQYQPEQNVIAYNYATKSHETVLGVDIPKPDLSFHGRYEDYSWGPSYNLVEGNYFDGAKFDMTHFENGPYNTLFRNSIYDVTTSGYTLEHPLYVLINSIQYMQNIVLNHTPSLSTSDFPDGFIYCSGSFSNCNPTDQFSYYKPFKPDFLNSWPFIPDFQQNAANIRSENMQLSTGNTAIYEGWQNYEISAEYICTDRIWSNDKHMHTSIIIGVNRTLTIENCNVYMPKKSEITLSRGSKLIINGGTIASLPNSTCHESSMWDGITMINDISYGQYEESEHSKVIINFGTIKDAICGIKSLGYIGSSYQPWKGGGIINAFNANFINNQTAIKMDQFQNTAPDGTFISDLSYFNICNFIKDDNYLNPIDYPFKSCVELNSVFGVKIYGCTFNNNTCCNTSDFKYAGFGITSYDATYDVEDFFNNPSEFHNFKYGIYSFNTNISKKISIKRTLFENNLHGVFIKNSNSNSLLSNIFRIPYYYLPISDNLVSSSYGMYLDHCSDFILESNSFESNYSSNKAPYGLLINESGQNTNKVYNNTFSNMLYAATQAQGNNRIPATNMGLKILCNQYSNNDQDISIVPSDIPAFSDGICLFQGKHATTAITDISNPAGNTFSKYGGSAFSDINNCCSDLVYFHHKSITFNELWIPEYCNPSPIIYKVNTNVQYPISDRSLACPGIAVQTGDILPYPNDPIELNTILDEKSKLYNSAKLIRDTWVDGGNTSSLLQEIKDASPWDSCQLYNDLISYSPYLSDFVLIDAINNEVVLPATMLKQILIANPQSVRSDIVMQALFNRINPLPDDTINEIMQVINDIAPRDTLEAEVSYCDAERKTCLDLLKINYLSDTTGNSFNLLIDLLSNETNIESKYELVFAQISKHDYNGAYTTLDNIGNQINPEKQPEEIARLLNMSLIIPILVNVESGEDTLENLPEYYINAITDLSTNDRGLAGSIATALLLRIDTNFVYNEPIYTYEEETLRMAKPIKKTKKTLTEETYLKINPNPANEFITVSYNINGDINGLRLFITDAIGKTVFIKQLNKANDEQMLIIKNYAKGNYICTLFNNGKIVKSKKFIKYN